MSKQLPSDGEIRRAAGKSANVPWYGRQECIVITARYMTYEQGVTAHSLCTMLEKPWEFAEEFKAAVLSELQSRGLDIELEDEPKESTDVPASQLQGMTHAELIEKLRKIQREKNRPNG